jgi:hypothetical protein
LVNNSLLPVTSGCFMVSSGFILHFGVFSSPWSLYPKNKKLDSTGWTLRAVPQSLPWNREIVVLWSKWCTYYQLLLLKTWNHCQLYMGFLSLILPVIITICVPILVILIIVPIIIINLFFSFFLLSFFIQCI